MPNLKAPKHLQAATRQWFEAVAEAYVLEDHHRRVLELAGTAWDRAEAARKAIAKRGLTFIDRFGAPHTRPEDAIERDGRLAFARIVRELDLDADVTPEPRRGPAIRSNRRG